MSNGEASHDDIIAAVAAIGERLNALDGHITEIKENIDELAERTQEMDKVLSYGRGAWKALAVLGGVIATIVGMAVAVAEFFRMAGP